MSSNLNIIINFIKMFYQSFIKSNYPKNIHPETPEEIDIEDAIDEDVIKRFKELGTSEYDLGSNVTLVVIVKNPYYYQPTDIALSVSDGTLTQPLFLSVNPEATAMTTVIYEITENDILNGEVTLSLEVEIDGQTFTADYTIDTIESPNPHLTLYAEETSTPSNNIAYNLGELVELGITVTNNGNITINDIMLYSAENDITSSLSNTELAPGEYANAIFSQYITENDILSNNIEYEITATGSYDVENIDCNNGVECTSIEITTVDPDYSLNLTYTVSSPSNGTDYVENEVVTITPTLENIGNITASDVEVYVYGTLLNSYTNIISPSMTINISSTSYTITSTDITNGYFEINGHVEWTSNEESQENDFNTEIPISNE